MDGMEESDSRRVDCILSRCIHHMKSYCRQALFIYHSKPQLDDVEWSDSRRVKAIFLSPNSKVDFEIVLHTKRTSTLLILML